MGSGGRRSQLLYKVDQLWNAKRTVYSLCLLWSSLRTEHPKIISVCSLQAVGYREHWLWSLRPDCEFHFHHNYRWDHRQAALSPTASVSSSKKKERIMSCWEGKIGKKRESTLRFFLNLKILRNRMYYLMIVTAETCAFSYFLILTFLFSSICLIGIVDVCLISRNCQPLMLWLKSIAKLTESKEQVQRDLQNKWFH